MRGVLPIAASRPARRALIGGPMLKERRSTDG